MSRAADLVAMLLRFAAWLVAPRRPGRTGASRAVRPRRAYESIVDRLVRSGEVRASVHEELRALGACTAATEQDTVTFAMPPVRGSFDWVVGLSSITIAVRFDAGGRALSGNVVAARTL